MSASTRLVRRAVGRPGSSQLGIADVEHETSDERGRDAVQEDREPPILRHLEMTSVREEGTYTFVIVVLMLLYIGCERRAWVNRIRSWMRGSVGSAAYLRQL